MIDIGASLARYHVSCTFRSIRCDVFCGAQLETEAVIHFPYLNPPPKGRRCETFIISNSKTHFLRHICTSFQNPGPRAQSHTSARRAKSIAPSGSNPVLSGDWLPTSPTHGGPSQHSHPQHEVLYLQFDERLARCIHSTSELPET